MEHLHQPHHQHQQQHQHLALVDVELQNSLMMEIVKMRTITLGVNGTVELVVVTTFQQTFVQIANVLIQILVLQLQPHQLQHLHQHLQQLRHHKMDVDLQNGFKMVGVILKTITLDVIGMEATVVTTLILDGTNIVKFRNFVNVWTQILELNCYEIAT